MRRLSQSRELLLAALLIGVLAWKTSGETNLPPLIPVTDATNYLNQEVVVRDVVVQIAVRSTVALLNLNQRFPGSPLTCVIHAGNTNKFPDLGVYLGQLVEVYGHVTTYQGRPQIVLNTTNQIRIIDAVASSSETPLEIGEPTRPAEASEQPTFTPQVSSPLVSSSAEAKPDRAVWVVLGIFGVIIGFFGAIILRLWRRRVDRTVAGSQSSTLTRLAASAEGTADSVAIEEWKQRALIAEAMAGQHGQMLREKIMPELMDFAKQSLVQGLFAQRGALIETQQMAQKALVELEERLAALQLSLPERIRAYEQRIAELEKEIGTQGEQVRALTRATLVLVQKKLETERERERASSFNWQGSRS